MTTPSTSSNNLAGNYDDPTISTYQLRVKDEIVEVGTGGASQQNSLNLPASFNGRLNISDFAFKPDASNKKQLSVTSQRGPRASSRGQAVVAAPGLKRKNSTPSGRNYISPPKRSRKPSGYAPPSTYAHLKPLTDALAHDLICLFVGLNPGLQTSIQGHAYAHPSNLFWKLLHSSGCTSRRCKPSEDQDLPRLYALGNTNIVSRPTRNGGELSKGEMDESVWTLEEKVRKWRPESVCLVGKSIWESVWRVRHGRGIKKEEFKYGWQDERENMGVALGIGHSKSEGQDVEDWKGAKVFVAASTSGLAASLLPTEKERIWRELGIWVEQRRLERIGTTEVTA